MLHDKYKNPPKKYRPSPFWSWNENLDIEETLRQIAEMDEAGMGGYFMHARGGLQTPYLKKEWFEQVRAATLEGDKRGMLAWGYDENGWPSGFGGGLVNGLGEKYQQKYLRCQVTDAPVLEEHTLTNVVIDGKNWHCYYEVNPFYVDTLDKTVIDEFIRSTHQVYKDTLGDDFGKMKGFFTDEPQVSRNGFPWSHCIAEEYTRLYGEDLLPMIPHMFTQTDKSAMVRYRFWRIVRDLFADSFNKNIHEWCKANDSALTGHMVIEEGFYDHILANGSCMTQYPHMDIPGMDHLGRSLACIQTDMQLASAAHQVGQKQLLSETFALSGWNVSFEDLRNIYENQMVHGINYLCQHLEGYSLRGIRKRDYPASLFKQQPWWKYYRLFNDMVSRIGMLLTEGEVHTDVLVLHTIESGWVKMGDRSTDRAVNDVCWRMMETMESLERHQIPYHLGDGGIMADLGKVENGKLVVGTQSYSLVIVPPSSCFGRRTFELLQEFKAQGGTVLFCEQKPHMIDGIITDEWTTLIDNCPTVAHDKVHLSIPAELQPYTVEYAGDHDENYVLATHRRFPDEGMTMIYLCNPCEVAHDIILHTAGGSACLFDAMTGDEKAVPYTAESGKLAIDFTLPEKGSAVFFVYDSVDRWPPAVKTATTAQPITDRLIGTWEIAEADDNTLTLDYCDVCFDGKNAGKNIPVSDVQEMACAFGREVKTEVSFRFHVRNKAFSRCQLMIETPEIFTITVNGHPVDNKDIGFCYDRSFRLIDIYPYVQANENIITLTCDFVQSATTYENLEKSLHFESEKNKLTYDMEIEAVYLKGDFGVFTDEPFEAIERRALRTGGGFVLDAMPDTVTDGALAPQGFPFFAGSMTFRKSISLTAKEADRAQFTISRLCSTVTEVAVNGTVAGNILWHPYALDIAPYCHEGKNEIEVTVTGNLRNLLGPFHLKEGESFSVCPHSFFHYSPLWLHGQNSQWDDRYCFVEYGLFF